MLSGVHGSLPLGHTFSLDAPEDLVEFSLTNLEGLVLWLE